MGFQRLIEVSATENLRGGNRYFRFAEFDEEFPATTTACRPDAAVSTENMCLAQESTQFPDVHDTKMNVEVHAEKCRS